MKIHYGIENIRRIKNLPEIEIRPITILVGRNSAGKSTFLRTLPLIRQSLQTRSSAPILWFGDFVDFGDLDSAIGEEAKDRKAVFKFTVHNLTGGNGPYFGYYGGYFWDTPSVKVASVSVRYIVGGKDNQTELRAIEINIPEENTEVSLIFGSGPKSIGEILIDGVAASFLSTPFGIRTIDNNLFATPIFYSKSPEKEGGERTLGRPNDFLIGALKNILKENAERKLSETTYLKEVSRIGSENILDDSTLARLEKTATTVTFKSIYQQLRLKEKGNFRKNVVEVQKLSRVFSILEALEEKLTEFFNNVVYLEPVRAASERFYRNQELEVSEIAPNGANFPMFLASLTESEMELFSKWVRSIFGYGVKLHRTGGHISIHLHTRDRSVNITDTGYGVSQILPVMGMMWWAQRGRGIVRQMGSRRIRRVKRPGLQTLAIEQPELHLHPAHQAKLADLFVSVVNRGISRDSRSNINLIVETHSEALINRLGELIERGKIKPSKIQIVVFSAAGDLGSPTDVSTSSFDEHGVLKDWPFGFFNYSD